MMSLESTIARISAIETALVPRQAQAAATATQPAPTSTAATTPSPASSYSTNFATQLQSALAPDQVSPLSAGNGSSPIVRIAESQVGQAEQPPGSNDSPAIAMYRGATAGAQAGEPWCAYFASWVAQQAGEPLGAQGQGLGYVGDIWSWAQSTGRAVPNGPGVVPKPGDLIVFGDHHVGIVEQVRPDGSVQTIEGNYSDQVSRVVRGAGEATGYVRMS